MKKKKKNKIPLFQIHNISLKLFMKNIDVRDILNDKNIFLKSRNKVFVSEQGRAKYVIFAANICENAHPWFEYLLCPTLLLEKSNDSNGIYLHCCPEN